VIVLHREPTDERIRTLGDRLSDRDPGVRTQARQALGDLSSRTEFRDAVIREGTRVLGGADWRGQEQAALLLSQLGHTPATRRLLELLQAPRPEAFIAAAAGLRRLAVPATVPIVHEFVRNEHKKLLASGPTAGRQEATAGAVDRQLTQLVQFLGEARYRAADSTFRALVPRVLPGGPVGNPSPVGLETRAAAVWGLGLFHEGNPDAALATILLGRLTDFNPGPGGVEYSRVRRMAAISLGRMKRIESVPTLKRFYSGRVNLDEVNNACGWAMSQITGEPLPPPGTIEQQMTGWLLSPLE
jgi:HEAT repeat protein